jgi:hypothetical protein
VVQDADDLQLSVVKAVENRVVPVDQAPNTSTDFRALATDPAPLGQQCKRAPDVVQPARADGRVAGSATQVVGGIQDVEASFR